MKTNTLKNENKILTTNKLKSKALVAQSNSSNRIIGFVGVGFACGFEDEKVEVEVEGAVGREDVGV